MNLVLASRSPRRQMLLERLGIPFQVRVPRLREQLRSGERPAAACRRLAREKAANVARRYPNDLVVGADTIVILNRAILGKPLDLENARRMLASLSGRTHQVKTAVALEAPGLPERTGFIQTTRVTFHPLEAEDIELYLARHPPLDKAGAYGIQDYSGIFVAGIQGDYHNVMGFPLARFYRLLKRRRLLARLAGFRDTPFDTQTT